MAGPVTNLRSLDSANFKTSKRADGVNDLIKSKLGLQHRYEPARLAIAHSLAIPEPALQLTGDDGDESGKVIMGKTLFGDDEMPIWVAMIVEKGRLVNPTVEDIQEQVRRHWHRGILLLQSEWENCGEVYEQFILFLAQRAGLPAHGEPTAAADREDWNAPQRGGAAIAVTLQLGDPGTDERTGETANWLLNGKGSPHVALMGGTGSGKTRLARSLLGQIREQTKVPCIIFDFKGDLASNPQFVSEVGARVVSSPANAVPLDVRPRSRTRPCDSVNRLSESPRTRLGPFRKTLCATQPVQPSKSFVPVSPLRLSQFAMNCLLSTLRPHGRQTLSPPPLMI